MSTNRLDTNAASLAASALVEPSSKVNDAQVQQSRTSASVPSGQNKAKMTDYLNAFYRGFITFTATVETAYNPLLQYGEKTDSNETLVNKGLTALGRRGKTYILDGDPKIESRLIANKYKILADSFLNEHFPKSIKDSNIERSLEFIVRTLRLLILNVEYHLSRDPAARKKHLEAAKAVSLFVIEKSLDWASDTSLWEHLFVSQKDKNKVYFDFCDLMEDLKNMLAADIKTLEDKLKDNRLPDSLANLQLVDGTLIQLFPITQLNRLLDRPIPMDILTKPAMIDLFKNESLSFHEFKTAAAEFHSPLIYNAIVNKENPNDDSIFNLVKNVFFGAARKRLRQELETVAFSDALSQTEKLARTIGTVTSTQAALPQPNREDDDAEHKESGLRSLEATNFALVPLRSSALQTQQPMPLVESAAADFGFNSLSHETQTLALQYHHNLDQHAGNRTLIVAALPKPLREIYSHPDRFSPNLVELVKAYVEEFVKGFYLNEQLIDLSENLANGEGFHAQGGNILTKEMLPLPNVRDSAVAAFVHLKTIMETQEYLSRQLRNKVPALSNSRQFRLNGNHAIVLANHMYERIDAEGVSSLRDLSSSLTIESRRNDSRAALKHWVGMTVRQIALQGMNVHISPLFRFFAPLLASTFAMADNQKQLLEEADRRQLQFVDHLPLRPLSLPPANTLQISVLEEITLKDLMAAKLAKLNGLTLGQILQGEIIEELGQFYLKVDEQQILLTAEVKEWILVNQAKSLRQVSANPNPALPNFESALKLLQAQDETDRLLKDALTKERTAADAQLTRTLELLPQFNRKADLSAKLSKWWVPFTIVGLPLFIATGLYRLFNSKAIKKDLQTHTELSNDAARLRTRIQEIDEALSAHTTKLAERAEERSKLERLQQLEQQSASQRNSREASAAAQTTPLSLAPQRLFSSSLPSVTDPVIILPPPVSQNMDEENGHDEEADLTKESEACAIAILRGLSHGDVQKLFQVEASQLAQLLATRLSKVTTNKLILENPARQESIYNRIIAKLLMPKPFESYVKNLLGFAQRQYKDTLLKFEPDAMLVALGATFDNAFPEIKNKNVKQYIIQVLAMPELEKQKASASAKPARH